MRYLILFILFISIIIIAETSENPILFDKDKDGISDYIEKNAGLDPEKDECAQSGCKGFSPLGMAGNDYYIIILDQSGSMEEKFGSDTRMDAAKRVVKKYIKYFPETLKLGLYTYGVEECSALNELKSPFKKLNRDKLTQKVEDLKPSGKTPIGESLKEFREKVVDHKGKYHVLLVTDGVESCNGNPVEEAKKLIELNNEKLSVSLSVVGLGVPGPEAQELQKIAEATGGEYFTANTIQELEEIFQKPLKQIIASYNGILCLHKELDQMIKCEQRRLDKLKLYSTKLSMPLPVKGISQEDKNLIVARLPEIEKASEGRIHSYEKIKKKGTEDYTIKIDEMSKFLTEIKKDE